MRPFPWSRERILKYEEQYWAQMCEAEQEFERLLFAKVGPAVANRKHYELAEFRLVCFWKLSSFPDIRLCQDEPAVREATSNALTGSSVREQVEAVTGLRGVRVRVASALLAVPLPEQHTVFDKKARAVLVNDGDRFELTADLRRNRLSLDFTADDYVRYLQTCKRIAEHFGVSLRQLDRGIWAYHTCQEGASKTP